MGRIVYAVDMDGERRTIRQLMEKYNRSRQTIYSHMRKFEGVWYVRPTQPHGRPKGIRAWWNEEQP